MIRVDVRAATGQDQTLFGIFRRNVPVETATQVDGDHPKKTGYESATASSPQYPFGICFCILIAGLAG